jgi:hypothetical protein
MSQARAKWLQRRDPAEQPKKNAALFSEDGVF